MVRTPEEETVRQDILNDLKKRGIENPSEDIVTFITTMRAIKKRNEQTLEKLINMKVNKEVKSWGTETLEEDTPDPVPLRKREAPPIKEVITLSGEKFNIPTPTKGSLVMEKEDNNEDDRPALTPRVLILQTLYIIGVSILTTLIYRYLVQQ